MFSLTLKRSSTGAQDTLLGILAFRVRTFGKRLESDLESPLTDGPGAFTAVSELATTRVNDAG